MPRQPRAAQFVQDGLADGAAFVGVGAGAEFVQQHQAVPVGLAQDGLDPLEVRPKVLSDCWRLCSSPTSSSTSRKTGGRAAPMHGDVQPALGHDDQQPDRLQRHGLAAGVGAGDDQQVEVGPQPHVDGHHGMPLLRRQAGQLLLVGLLDQQRVAGLEELEHAALGDLRAGHFELVGVLRLGREEVQLRQGPQARRRSRRARVHAEGQLVQQAVDLLPLLVLELHEAVVELHALGRLDEDGGAGVAGAVDHPLQPAAMLGLDGQDVAVLVELHAGGLEIAGDVRPADETVDDLAHLPLAGVDLTADGGQAFAGGIADLAALVDDRLDGADLAVEAAQLLAQGVQQGPVLPERGHPRPNGAAAGQRGPDGGEILHGGPAGGLGALQGLGDVRDAAERGRARVAQGGDHLAGLAQPALHRLGIAAGADAQRQLLAQAASAKPRQDLGGLGRTRACPA